MAHEPIQASLDAHAISHAHAHTEGIDYLLVEIDPDTDLLTKLFTHQDERVREAVIAALLSNSDLDFKVWRCPYLTCGVCVHAPALQHH
jgi:metal-dependent hydrolase (beta-lactamase superfamily II)